MDKNFIVIPPFYSGTSFEEIYNALRVAVSKTNLPIEFIGYTKPIKNNFVPKGFLDDDSYVYGQVEILRKLTKQPNISKLLFLDFFNPGLDLIRYLFELRKVTPKLGSLLYGGTFLSDDLYSWPWLKNYETAWFETYDVVYVSSKFLYQSSPVIYQKKLKVFPLGMDAFNPTKSSHKIKKYDVVFPHRLDDDKGISDFIHIASNMPNTAFVVTSPKRKQMLEQNKYYKQIEKISNITVKFEQDSSEYKKILSEAKIILSCAKQENFGYSVMKAVISGCIPVLPNKLCYPEFFNDEFLYSDLDQAIKLINKYLEQDSDSKLKNVVDNIKEFSFIPLLKDFFTT